MTGQRAVRWGLAAVVVLSVWLGAILVFGTVVAPAAFALLPTRSLAGALVGRVLPVLFWSGAVAGLLAAAAGRGGESSRRRTLLGGAVAVACLAAQLLVAPRIARVRTDVAVPIDRLERDDARRVAFGRLHAASVALLGVAGLSGAAALFFTIRALAASAGRHETSHPLHER